MEVTTKAETQSWSTEPHGKPEEIIVHPAHKRTLCRFLRSCCGCLRSPATRSCARTPDAASSPRTTAPLPNPRKKVLVLDLDETLVHSSTVPISDPDLVLRLAIDENDVLIYVNIRPGVQYLLERAQKQYQVAVYTASVSAYADAVIDALDPLGVVEVRLFREHCKVVDGMATKDLRLLGRDIREVVIVDVFPSQNSPNAYRFYKKNAIPILSFTDDREDKELFKLVNLLERLAPVKDVRAELAHLLKTSGLQPPLFEENITLLNECK